MFIWAINECKKYGSFNTYLELLYDIKDKISIQELYNASTTDINEKLIKIKREYSTW